MLLLLVSSSSSSSSSSYSCLLIITAIQQIHLSCISVKILVQLPVECAQIQLVKRN